MIYKDGHDYQQIEDNFYPVDDDLIARLEFARGYLCKQMIYYKEKEIAQYREFKEGDFRSGSSTAFSIFHRTCHPYFSLFQNFDYRMKRLTRFSAVLAQLSIITILLWLCYSQVFIDLGLTEMMGDHRPFYVSLALSLLTLPLPRRCCCCFETQMYLLKEKPEVEKEEPLVPVDKDEETEGL